MEPHTLIQKISLEPDITDSALEELKNMLNVAPVAVPRRKRRTILGKVSTALLSIAVILSCLLLFAHQFKLRLEGQQNVQVTGFAE